ncbi:MAG: ThiF family adenylyltransferase [Planctomycetes bacterium]|nr:ThiF family adenylyltransferase [Planctomycetota bacterium]
MAHLIQVGAGSGGMPVLDLVCRDPRIHQVTLIEPDIYKPHNVVRHLFPPSGIGEPKAELAEQWLKQIRPELDVRVLNSDLLDPAHAADIDTACATADIGICAADNEQAKLHWDGLMRRHRVPWTLGEVLSGGIGGFVHWFVPGGPCYGCVASHLQRSVTVDKPATPDYSQPGGATPEVTIPASKASIAVIAALHAHLTLELLADRAAFNPGFTSLLLTMQRVRDVFDEAYRPFRFRITRSAECLMCRPGQDGTTSGGTHGATSAPEDLDVALDQALARLGNPGNA